MLSFRQKIFLSYVIVFLAIVILLYPLVAKSVQIIQERNLKKQAVLLINQIKDAKTLDEMIKRLDARESYLFFRVSLLDPAAGIAYDSHRELGDLVDEESQLAHPEVEEAIAKDFGYSIRFSPIFDQEMAFMAVAFDFHGKEYVLRAAFPHGQIKEITRDYRYTFLGLLIFILFLFGFMAWGIIHYLAKPIQDIIAAVRPFQLGQEQEIPHIHFQKRALAKDEFAQLADTLNSLSFRIKEHIDTLVRERNDKETILESLGEGVIAIDEMMTVIFFNDMAEKLLKCKRENIVGKSFSTLHQHELHTLVREAKERREALSEVVIPEGKPRRYFDAIAVPRTKGEGIILVLQDTTSLHQVVELGRDFVANASHELKTPATVIRGFAETLHEHPELSREISREITKKIVASCERMDTLVRNLLTLATLDEGIPSQRLSTVDLTDLVEQAKLAILPIHPSAEVEIVEKNAPIEIQGDSDLLMQACINLLENAAKYSTPPAKIEVTLERTKSVVTAAFKDHGIGMPQVELSRIFDRFYSVDRSRSRSLGGSGLGLSIVERIIERHKGTIEVTSEPGIGTTFILSFPLT